MLRNFRSCSRLSLYTIAAALWAFGASGCSTISDSISDSISSPFKWSSRSSDSSRHHEASYRHDISNYTEVYVRSNSDVGGLRQGVATIAEKHGISNWEADTTSYVGIGEGLAMAKVPQGEVNTLKSVLANGEAIKSAAIQSGYERSL